MHPRRQRELKWFRGALAKGDTRLLNKTAVMGILDREQRKVRATVVKAVNREVLQTEILKHVSHGTRIYTNQAALRKSLPPAQYTHEFVHHLEKYVNGNSLLSSFCLVTP
jgi:hypothetical protein